MGRTSNLDILTISEVEKLIGATRKQGVSGDWNISRISKYKKRKGDRSIISDPCRHSGRERRFVDPPVGLLAALESAGH